VSNEVTQKEFREKIKGKEIKDIGVSARGTHIDVVLDDGEPYSTITVRGEDLEWEISEVRSVDTDGDSDV
jgi:hypothetical protein